MQKPETKFRQKVQKELDKLPNSWFESIQQKSFIGTPDILGCCNGHFVALELKATATSAISKMQEHKLKLIGQAGGIGIVVSPENWPNVLPMLRELCEEKHA